MAHPRMTSSLLSALTMLALASTVVMAEDRDDRPGRRAKVRIPDRIFATELSGEQQIPPARSGNRAKLIVLIRAPQTTARILLWMTDGNSATGVGLHCGRAGEVGPEIVNLLHSPGCEMGSNRLRCELVAADLTALSACGPQASPVTNIASLGQALESGLVYVNLTTASAPNGELRGQLSAIPDCGPGQASLFCDLCRAQGCACNDAGDKCTSCNTI